MDVTVTERSDGSPTFESYLEFPLGMLRKTEGGEKHQPPPYNTQI